MGKLWLNNEIVDRLAMLQHTEAGHPGSNRKGLVGYRYIEGIIPNRLS